MPIIARHRDGMTLAGMLFFWLAVFMPTSYAQLSGSPKAPAIPQISGKSVVTAPSSSNPGTDADKNQARVAGQVELVASPKYKPYFEGGRAVFPNTDQPKWSGPRRKRKKISRTRNIKTKKSSTSKKASKAQKKKSAEKTVSSKPPRKKRRRTVRRSCRFPLVYSRKYKKCLCIRSGYRKSGRRCVRVARTCPANAIWSFKRGRCLCRPGMELTGGKCVKIALEEDKEDDDEEEPPQLTGKNCPAPAKLIALGSSAQTGSRVGECPSGYHVTNGKCVPDTVAGQNLRDGSIPQGSSPLPYQRQQYQQGQQISGSSPRQAVQQTPPGITRAQPPYITGNAQGIDRPAPPMQGYYQNPNPGTGRGNVYRPRSPAIPRQGNAYAPPSGNWREVPQYTGAANNNNIMPSGMLREPVYDLGKIRACLLKAGFIDQELHRKMNSGSVFEPLYQAFARFRRANRLGHRPADLYDLPSQQVLFSLCARNRPGVPAMQVKQFNRATGYPVKPLMDQPERTREKRPPYRQNRERKGQQTSSRDLMDVPQVSSNIRKMPALKPAERTCLPEDLRDYIIASYGPRPALKKCKASCMPVPSGLALAERQKITRQYGVNWCTNCLSVRSYMPLKDIYRVEKRARVKVCMTPANRLKYPATPPVLAGKTYPRSLEFLKGLPAHAGPENGFMVLIGNGHYREAQMNKPAALADVAAMHTMLTRHLGYSSERILDLRDASLARIREVFGTGADEPGLLVRKMQKVKAQKLLIYYSGAALASTQNRQNYLLPVDVKPGEEKTGGYALRELYKRLRHLPVRQILLVMEAQFNSKVSNQIAPPNLPDTLLELQPVIPVPGLTIITAGHGRQQLLVDPVYGVSLFTRYFLAGLAGEADRAPLGNANGVVDLVELYAYTADAVRLNAQKSFGLLQTPKVYQMLNIGLTSLNGPAK